MPIEKYISSPVSTWYLGTVGNGSSYRLAKYTDINMSSLTSNITNAIKSPKSNPSTTSKMEKT